MTCIIGIRCKDGVVIVADKRVVKGEEIEDNACKIIDTGMGLVAYSGLTGLTEDEFIPALINRAERLRVMTIRELKKAVEEAVFEVYDEYRRRIGNDAGIYCFLAGLENITSGKAVLYKVYPEGYAEIITRYEATGSGHVFARPFLKAMYTPQLTIEQGVVLGTFIIMTIEKLGLDRNVGGGVDIGIVKDSDKVQEGEKAIEIFDDEKKKEYLKKAEDMFNKFKKLGEEISGSA